MAEKAGDQPKGARQVPNHQPHESALQEMEGFEPIAIAPTSALQRAMPPAPLNPSDVLSLQRAVGNRVVTRLLAQRRQMTLPLQRQEEEEELQTKPADQAERAAAAGLPQVDSELEDSINAARGHGEPLPAHVREPMELGLGADLGGVRIHADSDADSLSQSLQARAFTTGQDVFFKSNEYKPDSSSGQKLIAHELTHVLQQGAGNVARSAQRSRISSPVRQRPSLAGRIQREGGKKKKRPRNIALDPKFANRFQHNIEKHHPIGKEILSGIHEEFRREGIEVKAPLETRQVPAKQSPFQALMAEINKLIDSGGGKKTTVLAVTDLKGAGKKITELLEQFHSQTEDGQRGAHLRWALSDSLRDEITKWKKRNALAFWKKNTRQKLTTLDGQLASETERLWALKQAYDILLELCQKAIEIDQRPLPTRASSDEAVDDIKRKIEEFRSDVLAKLPGEERRTELAWVLAQKVQLSISALERDQRRLQKGLLEGPQLEEKRAQFEGQEGKVEQLFKAAGFAGVGGQESLTHFGHKLEALDPQHRDYDSLINLFNKWLREKSGKSLNEFFTWVDRYEQITGTQLDRTRYIKEEDERRKYKLGFKGAQPYYSERTAYYQEKSDPKQREKDKELKHGIYVMTPDGEFYARREMGQGARTRTFHHSSLLAGLPVGAAGKITKISGGLRIDLDSGHYQPKARHMLNAVKGLKKKGVPLEKVKVQPFFFEGKQGWKPSAQAFLDDLKLLRETRGKEGGNLALMASRVGKEKEIEEAYQAYSS